MYIHQTTEYIQNMRGFPDLCGPVGWASSCKVKPHQFDSPSGHVPGLCVWFQSDRGHRLMFLSLSPSPSLPLL